MTHDDPRGAGTSTGIDETLEVFEGNPFAGGDTEKMLAFRNELEERHLLAILRDEAQMTLASVAERRGVTPDAARKAENQAIETMRLGTIVDQLRAIGYDIDPRWVVAVVAAALPERTLRGA